jgi:hypothetical protein
MAKTRGTVFCLLAGLLFGTSTTVEAAAKPAHHGRIHRHGQSGQQSLHNTPASVSKPALDPSSGSDSTKTENQGAPMNDRGTRTPSGVAVSNQDGAARSGKQNISAEHPPSTTVETNGSPEKTSKPPDIHMNDLGAVDTHITVQPRLHGPNRNDGGEGKDKTKTHALTPTRPRPQSVAPPRQGETDRNAIGVSVPASREASGGGQNSVSNPPRVTRAISPVVRGGGTGIGKTAESPDRVAIPQPNHRTVAVPASSGAAATINGSGFHRRGLASGTVGGPINTATGINGSTIRPKH